MLPSRTILLFVAVFANLNPLTAQSLSERIDQGIRAGCKDYAKLASSMADDAEFLRRVYLDLAGVIPCAKDARQFLADNAPDKRAKLVDQLLAGDNYARNMTQIFDVLLLDRRADKFVKRAEWTEFLRSSFVANKPYDQLVREILSADGGDPKTRAAAAFFLNRDAEPHQITKDVSRLFLGLNLQCAQCHDHPLIDHYKQNHYYGVFAFFNRSYLFTDKKTKLSVYAEKAEGDVSFQSVFMAKVTKNTGPRLPGAKEIQEPKFDKGQEYEKPVGKGERGVPKFSRRAQLAQLIASPDNPRFARSAMNRLWSFYLGRGIIQPLEFDHPDNPPSHPELLDLLAKEFVARKFDLKAMIREIVLSETYQRSSVLPKDTADLDAKFFAVAPLRHLTPEQYAWSLMQATGLTDSERVLQGAKPNPTAIFAKLAGNVNQFVTLFGQQPGEPAVNFDFEATLDQTLFLRNGSVLAGWLAPKAGNLLDRLGKLKEADQVADELYLSVLTRLPSADEKREVNDFLQRRGADRPMALQDLAWALVTSTEFRFNH